MIKNYLTTALRHLLKNKGTAFINITGLALGVTCLLTILAVVRYELSFDRFHSDAERIYRVVRVSQIDGETEYRPGVSYPLPDALKEGLTAAQKVAAIQYEGSIQVSIFDNTSGEVLQLFQEKEGFGFVEPAFFDIFDFKGSDFHWIAGGPETSLQEPFTVVLTQSLANKYFPQGEALGKSLKLQNQADVKVTGVVSDFPANSDFPFRIMVSYATLNAMLRDRSDWGSVTDANQCYVLLNEGATTAEVEAQIAKIHAARGGENLAKFRSYKLQPLHQVHTDARFGNFSNRTVSRETIWALAVIGLFIIFTAGINFVNLTTAQSVMRSKEVGIRKVMGSSRMRLVLQFLGETFLITLLAGMLALGAAELVMLYGKDFLQIGAEKGLITDPFILFALLGIILLVTLLAGSYPALVMSGFNPVAALKSKINAGSQKGMRLRWGLVTLQFVIAQIFIIGTLVIIRQMEYFRHADLGFDQEAIIFMRLPENQPQTLQTIKNQWETDASIQSISFSYSVPSGTGKNGNWQDIRRKGAPEGEEGIVFEHQSIDENYLGLYQIPLLAGRNFLPTDTMQSIILNCTLCERAGFAQPSDALGETMMVFDKAFTVVGVSEDFHTSSLKDEIGYLAFTMLPGRYRTASIKLNITPGAPESAGQLQEAIRQIEKVWAATYPDYVFEYQFLDESIAAYYREETRLTQLFKILASITIFIGCLGLYGLVAFMAVRRTKEVGIRKVLGASVQHILVLFSKEFIALVLVSFCIAGPVAYYLMQQWLENFVYKVDIGAGVFVGAVLASILIAVLTVGYQAVKAAVANPVESLRSE